MQDLKAKDVGRCGSIEFVPVFTSVRCVVVLIGFRDEVCSVVTECVVVERDETFLRKKLGPCVAFVAGLPNRVIG